MTIVIYSGQTLSCTMAKCSSSDTARVAAAITYRLCAMHLVRWGLAGTSSPACAAFHEAYDMVDASWWPKIARLPGERASNSRQRPGDEMNQRLRAAVNELGIAAVAGVLLAPFWAVCKVMSSIVLSLQMPLDPHRS